MYFASHLLKFRRAGEMLNSLRNKYLRNCLVVCEGLSEYNMIKMFVFYWWYIRI